MCKYMSALVTPHGIIMENTTDSHEDLIQRYELKDDRLENRQFVRVEYTPTDHGWIYKVDEEETLPKWYDEEKAVRAVHRAACARLRGLRTKCAPGESLYRANLSAADLSGANLFGADLSRADLSGANLSRADLSSADLSGANLFAANLSRADLSSADLSGANLFGANLVGADLFGADLSRANLFAANLSGARMPDGTIHD